MKNVLTIISFLALLGVNSSCNDAKAKKTQPLTKEKITIKEFLNIKNSDMEYILVDVRTPIEIGLGKIENDALEYDFLTQGFDEKISKLDQDKNYIIYCASGARSGKTQSRMKQMGFKYVANLQGGMNGWKMAKFN